MIAPPRAAWLFAQLLLIAALAAPAPATASTEEFSTFDVLRPEEDDESLLDHLLTSAPRAWDEEWRRAPMAVRTLQGCLTSGQWINRTQLRTQAPLGQRARFGVELDQSEDDFASWNHLDFTFRFPQRFGTVGAAFRPFYDKSRQDFAFFYEAGADTAPAFLQLTFTFEDMFNNLWAWRQTRVGDESEPYERHPYEPAIRLGARGERWRGEASAKWLTPSEKRLPGPPGSARKQRHGLWGAFGDARVELDALGATWEATAMNRQAWSSDLAIPDPLGREPYTAADSAAFTAGDDQRYRRLWRGGLAVRRASGPWTAELRALYQERAETWAPPAGPARFGALDRTLGFEVTRRVNAALDLRTGILFDRVGVAREGNLPAPPHLSRDEKRLYLGLDARFGNVRVFGVEGIELDDEAYDVWLIHDKGFLGLQATF